MMWVNSIQWLPHRRPESWSRSIETDYKKLIKTLTRKPIHWKFTKHLDNECIDAELSFQWIKHITLKGEKEGLIIIVQDQSINSRYCHKHILKKGAIGKCIICHIQPRLWGNIISRCQTLAAEKYLNRHNQVTAQLHTEICKHYGIKVDAQHWYQNSSELATENDKVTMIRDSLIISNRYIPCNKPGIVIRERERDTFLLIDVAKPGEYNI